MEFADNGTWYMLKSMIQLHLDFSEIASYLSILFSLYLQGKYYLQCVCKKEEDHFCCIISDLLSSADEPVPAAQRTSW